MLKPCFVLSVEPMRKVLNERFEHSYGVKEASVGTSIELFFYRE